jgi:hypothetical protein
MIAPTKDYQERLASREARSNALKVLHGRIGAGRLAAAILTIAAIWWLHLTHALSSAWILAPLAVFLALVGYHLRVRRERARTERAANFYRRGLARIEDRWAGTGQQGSRFDAAHHVYAGDLDLFGRGSLFELLCSARTRMGEECLARWLLAPAPVDVILARQRAVADLRTRTDLREELAVQGEGPAAGVQPEALLEWAEAANLLEVPAQQGIRLSLPTLAGVVLPVLAIVTAIIGLMTGFGTPFYLVLLGEIAILLALGKKIARILHGTESAFEDLRLLSELLLRIEREPFQAPSLQALVRKLSSHTLPASKTIGELSTIVNLAGSRRNQAIALFTVPLLYTLNVALAAERWRRKHGTVVRAWIEAIGEIEALVSLAGYSYEHPDDPFPELIDGAVTFEGSALGHPLIPAQRCVRNDVSVGGSSKVLLISGSNMSGKSTLLRTVGVNTVLAMTGAPVRARRLRLSPVQVGASIRINDSLHEGSSRFYAEITRIRQLLDLLSQGRQLLFLLDELLQGTNSRDRKIGAEGIVRGFVTRGAVGLITTHDLAVTDLSGLGEGVLHNMHLQDELRDGRMTFDFTLREGVVTKSNGVELMRSIGLEV